MHFRAVRFSLAIAAGLLAAAVRAELRLPTILSDHMVLQQKQANPIWGWDDPGTRVQVSFGGRTYQGVAGADGRWVVKLDAAPANATPQTLTVEGTSRRQVMDILIGEVWVCSGQSNMAFRLTSDWNGDLEAAASHFPQIRLITVPRVGTQELQTLFKGQWEAATPETAIAFSAVGFLYGRYLHQILGVPVGLINDSWGGSPAEGWIRRSRLEQDARFQQIMATAVAREAEAQTPQAMAAHEAALAKHKAAAEKALAEKRTPPNPPPAPSAYLASNARPGNIFNGMLYPIIGYGIKGVIWYQGESNATRAHEYGELFPFLIQEWRREWGQGDFPFYWVQLADFRAEKAEPAESDWAELREAQTRTLRLPNTGQAVITDLGEGKDIHPRNKHDVAARLVRWALARDYGMTLPYRSPEYQEAQFKGGRAVVTFNGYGSKLRLFDVEQPRGFALCGADRVWHWASGRVTGENQIELWSDAVREPVAVRYGWADNPTGNVFSADGLPLTPFRTDDFDPITKPKPAP